MCYPKVFVPLSHEAENGWFFKMVCPGNALSVFHEGLLLLKNASVNKNLGFNDVCREKQVYAGYNNDALYFELNNITEEMVLYPVQPYVRSVDMAHEWEIQTAFFKYNNIEPKWFNANFTWGNINYTTGQWSGAVGMIQRDEVDYAIFDFGCTYARSKVAACSPATSYFPVHWLTRYPKELSPTWNLFGLFTKVSFTIETFVEFC